MTVEREELESQARAWRIIEEAWIRYCHKGADAYDWDFDSRSDMGELTGHRPFGRCEHDARP